MSERRDDLLLIRTALIKGDPPYTVDEVMGTLRREKGGSPGLDELKRIGDFAPGAASLRLLFETQIKIVELMLERTR